MSPMPDRCPLTLDELVILIGLFSLFAVMLWGIGILIRRMVIGFLDSEREFRNNQMEEAVKRVQEEKNDRQS